MDRGTHKGTNRRDHLPRSCAASHRGLSGHSWVAGLVVVFWWAQQHCALPLVPDLKYLAFRFVAFLPGVTLLTVIYLRIRRLAPMIVAHWPMDLGAVIMTLKL